MKSPTRKMRMDVEHGTQVACVAWFRFAYRQYRLRLIAIPNGGWRDPIVAAKLKGEGVTAGVADLALFVPRKGYSALFIEMKTMSRNSRQSDAQRVWEADITKDGEYIYKVCRSVDEFIKVIKDYLE